MGPEDRREPEIVERKTAASGAVEYTEPITIHDSRDMRIEAVPFFIPRTEGEELSVKLIRSTKSAAGFRRVFPDAELNLSAAATKRLSDWLGKLFALIGQPPGQHLVIPLEGGSAQLEGHDPSQVAAAVVTLLSRPEVMGRLPELSVADEVANALQAGLRVLDLRVALRSLRELLDRGIADEATYQTWCEHHAWVFGGAYHDPDQTRTIAVGDQVDMLLPLVVSGLRDIVELKRPDHDVLKWDDAHRNWYWSVDVSRAIGQVERYLDRLESSVAAGALRDHPEILAHRPRALVVIGRSFDWDADKSRALHDLNGRLHGVTIQTYDHLLQQGERMLELHASRGTLGSV